MGSACAAAPLFAVAAFSGQAAEVNVTQDPSHVWGAPILAVNPKNPDDIVLSTIGIAFTKACAEKAKTDPKSPCADMEVIPMGMGGRGGIHTRPVGMMTDVPGFVMVTAWASFDRGKTWRRTAEVKEGGNLPVFPPDLYRGPALSDANGLAAGPDGVFHLGWDATHFADVPYYTDFGGIPMSKSIDGGKTWSTPVRSGSSLDGGRMVADSNTGVIYTLSSGAPGPGPTSSLDPKVRVFRTTVPTGMDRHMLTSKDGVHWSEPHIIGGGGASGSAANGLFATAFRTTGSSDYLNVGRSNANNELCGSAATPCMIFQTTKDGGATWDRHVMSVPSDYGNPQVAADPAKAGHFALAFSVNGDAELDVYQTIDAGETWNAPTKLTAEAGKTISNVSMDYGPKGELGVVWKSRNAPPTPSAGAPAAGQGGGFGGQNRSPFNVLVAVSKDGGTTFSRPLKMSSAESPAPPTDRQFALSRDGSASIVLTADEVLVAWPDWRTEDASIMFNAAKLSDFKS
jgi:photosystem II stability/assembly factor-like uncharacterized protein